MVSFQIVAILVSVAALFAYLNHRYLHLHPTVGIMVQALAASFGWIVLERFVPKARDLSADFRQHLDLNEALFHWMLGPLLFAGALHVDTSELRNRRVAVAVLSLLGTLFSTTLIAATSYAVLRVLGYGVPFGVCALFGAIISPTDPVAVLGFLKSIDAPKELEAVIGGESLFNDGVGVVLFSVLAHVGGRHEFSALGLTWDFLRQTTGGAMVGLLAGLIVLRMLKNASNYQVEVLLTVALALGGYALADTLDLSGPIAAVVAGLVIGNHGRSMRVTDSARQHVNEFWGLVDETMNAVLFLMVGLVGLELQSGGRQLLLQAGAITIALLARWASVWVSMKLIETGQSPANRLGPNAVAMLTWGGLRGGLAIAMALSLPAGEFRSAIVTATFGVVVFSVLAQGGSLNYAFTRWLSLTHKPAAG